MNSNRTRYASTPTYGMQKRTKKTAQRQAPQQPDFSQAPAPLTGMPFQQPPVTAPLQPAQPMPFYSPTAAPVQQPQQVPFATPTFMQSGVPLPPMQSTMPPPMGNSVPPLQSSAFSSRSQGFVPPVQPQQPAAPTVQPLSSMQQPFASMQQSSIPPFGGTAQPQQQPSAFGFQPAQQPQPAPFVQPQPAPKREPQPMDADKVWTVFLFGLLPLLFIPCIFVTGMWSWVRFVFIGATVIGLGGMWYRQMYTPTTRLIVSMLYMALCIGSIAMLMQGANDVQQTSFNQSPAAQQQQAAVPSDSPTPMLAAVEEPQATPTPPPVSGPSEAEKRLELFMNLWMVNNTNEMVQLVQPSWCSQQESASVELFKVLANRTPEDFTIEEISGTDTDNSRTITMRATINKNTGKAPSIYRFMVMMVREGGEWYVNPNSLATNDVQEKTAADENVVNAQKTGTVTEAPRTTVTPAPPASTSLYYNLGANFYHMDPNCESVKAEYLPFDVSFLYSELGAVRSANGLSPCLRCNAPTNTLD